MWLSNLFTKKNDNAYEDSINKDKVNEESINISSKHEEEPVIDDLKNRVKKVKMIHAKLQSLLNKQDLNFNNSSSNTPRDKDKQITSTNKNEKKLDINNCKIENVLKIIPFIENNLQSLTEEVSCLSKQLNAKIETEQNIISNNANINSASNSVNKLNDVVNKTIPTNQDTPLRLVSKENIKTRKHKRSVIIKKKYSYQKVKIRNNSTKIINKDDQKDKVTNKENVLEFGVKSIDQLTNLDGQLESFFIKVQSALTQHKIDQAKEKSDIMFNLSRLVDIINMNYTKMDKFMSDFEHLSTINDPVNHKILKNQSNLEIENKHELQKSVDDIKICIDYLIKPNPIDILQTQQSVTTDTPITNTNINGTCNSNRCVCKLINNSNTESTQIIHTHGIKNKIKGNIILCEFLKANLSLERIKIDENQQIAQVDQFSDQIDSKKNSHLSVCSKKSNNFSNICDGNKIEDQITSHLSVCSKKSNHISNSFDGNIIDNQKTSHLSICSKKSNSLKNNGGRQEKPKINHLTVCPKQSIHHFFKIGVENSTTSNQPNIKKSVCEKNEICDFLSSQPIPEWIKLDEKFVKSDNLCCKNGAKSSPSNCHLNVNKFYNIERIISDCHGKNDIVYEITQKPDVPKEKKNDLIFKEQHLALCNSLNNDP